MRRRAVGERAAEEEAAAKLRARTRTEGFHCCRDEAAIDVPGDHCAATLKLPPDKRVTSINFDAGQASTTRRSIWRQSSIELTTVNAGELQDHGRPVEVSSPVLTGDDLPGAGQHSDHRRGLGPSSPVGGSARRSTFPTPGFGRGLDDIAALSSLKILNLSKTKVTDAGAKKLLPLGQPRIGSCSPTPRSPTPDWSIWPT